MVLRPARLCIGIRLRMGGSETGIRRRGEKKRKKERRERIEEESLTPLFASANDGRTRVLALRL